MIISNILGGLGNQMFQYAVGRRLAEVTGQPFRLDLQDMRGYTVHRYGLDQFAISAPEATEADLPPRGPKSRTLRRIDEALRRVIGRAGPRRVVEQGYTFDPEILALREPVHLTGYWQSEKYFRDIADVIRADFALAQPMTPSREALRQQIAACNSVSVHVRRGDYVTNPDAAAVHGTCSPQWYAAAIERVSSGLVDPVWFVFSDDPDWVRANIATPPGTVHVDPQSDRRDAEDMHLMAACRAHIVANSTFSWWAAWLDPRADKRVVAPARWFADASKDTRDLIPQSWERL